MALELRGSELPVSGYVKILLNVSNARLHSDTIESHHHPQAEAQAFVLLKDPGGRFYSQGQGPLVCGIHSTWFPH